MSEAPRGDPPPCTPRAPPAATIGAADAPARYLGRGYQGAVYVAGAGPDRVVIKQALGGHIARRLRRAMLRREFAVYQRLAGLAGIPRCKGLREDDSLVLEFVDGESFRESAAALHDRGAFFGELLQIILALHRTGVAHADLKRRGNILIGRDGHPWLVDFGSAILRSERGGLLNRLLFRQAARMDLNAWIKLKYRRSYGEIAPEDQSFYQPTFVESAARVIRRAWRRLTARQFRKAWRRRRAGL